VDSTDTRVPPGPPRRRRWPVLAPVAAAALIAALAITLALVRDMPSGRVAAPASAAASATSASTPGGTPVTDAVPGYYVALMPAGTPSLAVVNAVTGKRFATIASPPGVRLEAVYGTAADNRTFIAAGQATPAAGGGTIWYLLQIAPGSTGQVVRFGALPIPVNHQVAGAALSPDGTELAVAQPGSPATLQVYSVATGTLLHAWTTKTPGQITVVPGQTDSWQLSTVALRWSADGQQLGFAWNGSAIRVLDASAPDGDLVGSSRSLSTIGIVYATLGSFSCDAAQGWQLIQQGQGVVCAGSTEQDNYHSCGANGKGCSYVQRFAVGFYRQTSVSGGGTELTTLNSVSTTESQAKSGHGAYLGWANDDASTLIGSLVPNGTTRFGIFRGSKFTPYPALLVPLLAPAGAMPGIVAW